MNSYLITRLDKTSVDFITYLTNGKRGMSKESAFGIAKAIADTISLPTSPVDSVDDYYKSVNYISVRKTVSRINEVTYINVELVLEYIYRLYEVKYNCVYACNDMVICTEFPLADVFGFTLYLDKDTIELIKTKAPEIAKVYNDARPLIKCLNEVLM